MITITTALFALVVLSFPFTAMASLQSACKLFQGTSWKLKLYDSFHMSYLKNTTTLLR